MQSLPCLYFHKDPPNMNISSSCLFCGKLKAVIRLFLLVFSCSPRESEVTCDTSDDIGCQRQLYLYVKREFSLMLPSKCVSSNCYARGDFSKQELKQSSEYLSAISQVAGTPPIWKIIDSSGQGRGPSLYSAVYRSV